MAPNLGAGSSSRAPLFDDIEYTGRGGTDNNGDTKDKSSQHGLPWVRSIFNANPYSDKIGPSQLGGAPLFPTQVSHEDVATPVADKAGCPARQVVRPDTLTYSQHHTRAAQAAQRRARKVAEGAQRHKRRLI
ncbi:unnamed protein product [Urochloa humidicola]